jgi:hypothetical protein
MSASRADVVAAAADTTPPNKPTVVVTKNAAGYAAGNTPLVNGRANRRDHQGIPNDNKLVGTATVDANGLWSTKLSAARGWLELRHLRHRDRCGGQCVDGQRHGELQRRRHPAVKPTYSSLHGWQQPDHVQRHRRSRHHHRTGAQRRPADDRPHDRRRQRQLAHRHAPLPNGSYTVSVVSSDMAATAPAPRPVRAGPSTARRTSPARRQRGRAEGWRRQQCGRRRRRISIPSSTPVRTTTSPSPRRTGASTWSTRPAANGHDSLINVERIQFDDGYRGDRYRRHRRPALPPVFGRSRPRAG